MRFKMVKVRKRIKVITLILVILIVITLGIVFLTKKEQENAKILKKNEREEVQIIVNKINEKTKADKELEAIANRLDESFEFKLANQGKLYASYCKEKGVDPYLAAAISIHETYRGASPEITEYNNVGGMRYGGKALQFDTIEAGIIKFIDNIADNYIEKGLDTPEKMQAKYAGGSTSWAKNVNYFYTHIKDGSYKAGLPLNTKYASSVWY